MGKKDKAKKKGKGAEKTAEKTQKKMKMKVQKATGEDDIETIVKAIEEEERRRKDVKEVAVGPPSHRSNVSLCAHPEHPELVLFGGEFYNGNKTVMFNELLLYNIKRKEWTQVRSPAGPPPRSSHQAVITAQSGGQLWLFGGEFASASESQFHHYRDLWAFHFGSKRWEKVTGAHGTTPTSRSGHRMVLLKKHLVIFGGFHDNLSECKYYNDVNVFSLEERAWRKVNLSGSGPGPRSGCCMVTLSDGRILVYGGFCKEKKVSGGRKKEAAEEGRTLVDMFLLVPDKHDATLSTWRWLPVKQVGMKPSARSGISAIALPTTNRVLLFGGVQDNDLDIDSDDSSDEDEEKGSGVFYNDMYSIHIENERATWNKVELSGRKEAQSKLKKRRRQDKKGGDEDDEEEDQEEDIQTTEANIKAMSLQTPETVTVEDGAFTITSTVSGGNPPEARGGGGDDDSGADNKNKTSTKVPQAFAPSPRFGSAMALRQGTLYLFGGMVEDASDRQLTHKDLYCLDIHKMDEWDILIESDVKSMEWVDSESGSGSESESDDEENEEEEMDM